MKLHVLHDESGNILSLALPTTERETQVSVKPRRNERTTVVEIPDAERSNWHPRLRDIADNQKLDLGADPPKLVEKTK